MALPRKLARPDFEAPNVGVWLNPDHLPIEAKASLWELLPKRMTHDQKAHFLSLVGESVQGVTAFRQAAPAAAQVAELRLIEDRARGLLIALGKLSGDTRRALKAHATYLALGSDPPDRLSASAVGVVLNVDLSLAGYWWDTVQDIETATAYTAAQFEPAKNERPKIANARLLAMHAARNYYSVAGKLPPSGKRSWFAPFTAELGKFAGSSIGAALVESVVLEMRGLGEYPDKAPAATPTRVRAFFKAPKKPPD